MSQGGKPPQQGGAPAKKPLNTRTVTLTLTVPTCITLCIGTAVSFIVIFFLGIILGRGHTPETNFPGLNRMMPQTAPITPARVIANDVPQATRQQAGNTGGNSRGETPGSIPMTTQDLGFHDSLKERPKVTPSSSRRAATQQANPQKKETVSPAQTAAKQPTAEQEKPAGKKQKFNYQFQVAAYKNQQQADAMTAKLKQSGLSVKTEKTTENGTVWYKNIVSFQGTADDVDILRKKLQQHKITTLIRKEKKAVTP